MKKALDHLTQLEQAVWASAFAQVISGYDGQYAQVPQDTRREWREHATSIADDAVAALRETIDQPQERLVNRQSRADLTGFVYGIQPIDFWEGWSTAEEIDARARREHTTLRDAGIDADFHSCLATVAIARREIDLCARGHDGWREGPYVAALPDPPDSQLIVAMKGENNGDTYVWSKFALPWLDSEAFELWFPAKGAR